MVMGPCALRCVTVTLLVALSACQQPPFLDGDNLLAITNGTLIDEGPAMVRAHVRRSHPAC